MYTNQLQEKQQKIIFKASLNKYEVDILGNIEGKLIIYNTTPIHLIDLNIEFVCTENISNIKQEKLNKNVLMQNKILSKSKILNCGKHCFPFLIRLNNLGLIYPSFDSLINLRDLETNKIALKEIICLYELRFYFSYTEDLTITSDSRKKLSTNSNITIMQNLSFPHTKYFVNEISLCSSLYEILNLFKSKIMRIEIQLNKPFYRIGEELRIQISNDHFLNEVEIELVKYTIQHLKNTEINVLIDNPILKEEKQEEVKERKCIEVFRIKNIKRKVVISTLKIPITTQPNILSDSITILYFLEYKIKVFNSNNVIACRMGLNVFNSELMMIDETQHVDFVEVGEENIFPVFYI